MDFVNLVKFIFTREERVQRQHFKEDTANTPYVHFVTVVAVRHEALGRTVPPSRYVLSERRFVVEASATAQISQFNRLLRQQNVLPNS